MRVGPAQQPEAPWRDELAQCDASTKMTTIQDDSLQAPVFAPDGSD